MEPEVVEDDFQRFQKENQDKWKLIDESLEKCLEIDGQGESVSFQVRKEHFYNFLVIDQRRINNFKFIAI